MWVKEEEDTGYGTSVLLERHHVDTTIAEERVHKNRRGETDNFHRRKVSEGESQGI